MPRLRTVVTVMTTITALSSISLPTPVLPVSTSTLPSAPTVLLTAASADAPGGSPVASSTTTNTEADTIMMRLLEVTTASSMQDNDVNEDEVGRGTISRGIITAIVVILMILIVFLIALSCLYMKRWLLLLPSRRRSYMSGAPTALQQNPIHGRGVPTARTGAGTYPPPQPASSNDSVDTLPVYQAPPPSYARCGTHVQSSPRSLIQQHPRRRPSLDIRDGWQQPQHPPPTYHNDNIRS